jgi:phenylacetate-CoA ligase
MPIWNEREECLDLDERQQQQIERLQSTLNRAYKNVPFYRNNFERHEVEPSQVGSFGDLSRVPFTEPQHFSEHYPYGLFAVPLRDVVRIHSAPGSGLLPTVSGYTKQDLLVWHEMVARALTAAGVSPADILQIELDPGLTNWGRDYKDGAELVGAGVIPLTLLPPEKQLMILKDYKTSVLVTSASAAEQLAQNLFRADINPNILALKTLVLVGEHADPETRIRLEEQLHSRTWVHYGLSEVPGPALAFECEARQGLHISEDHFLPEVVDPASGRQVEEGESGELVLTTLTTRAFPLVRFRTGDRVRILPGRCSCGRTLRRMEWFPRRMDDILVIRGVKIHHGQVLLLLERALGFVPSTCRFLIVRHDLRDCLEVWLKVEERFYSDEIKEMERLSRSLAADLSQELGVPVVIRLKEEGSFKDFGPANGVIDLRFRT